MHKNCPQELYEQVEKTGNWHVLIPYPCLLFRWQYKHMEDKKLVKKIAMIASHRRGRHLFCQEKCAELEAWLKQFPTVHASS